MRVIFISIGNQRQTECFFVAPPGTRGTKIFTYSNRFTQSIYSYCVNVFIYNINRLSAIKFHICLLVFEEEPTVGEKGVELRSNGRRFHYYSPVLTSIHREWHMQSSKGPSQLPFHGVIQSSLIFYHKTLQNGLNTLYTLSCLSFSSLAETERRWFILSSDHFRGVRFVTCVAYLQRTDLSGTAAYVIMPENNPYTAVPSA